MTDESKIRQAQLEIMKQRLVPYSTFGDKGVKIRRGLRRRLVDNPLRFFDVVEFEAPVYFNGRKLRKISVWQLLYETHFKRWTFEKNPLEDRKGFVQELHDYLMGLERSRLYPNDFTFNFERVTREREGKPPRMELAVGDEKFESERFPKRYKLGLKLLWRAKL